VESQTRLHPPAHDVQRVRHRLRDEAGDGAEAQHELDRKPRRGGAVGHHGVLPVLLLQGLRGGVRSLAGRINAILRYDGRS